MNGPVALPSADIEVATPFSVPNSLKLRAELVMSMVVHGNAKMEAQHFSIITQNTEICCVAGVGHKTVKGVRR